MTAVQTLHAPPPTTTATTDAGITHVGLLLILPCVMVGRRIVKMQRYLGGMAVMNLLYVPMEPTV